MSHSSWEGVRGSEDNIKQNEVTIAIDTYCRTNFVSKYQVFLWVSQLLTTVTDETLAMEGRVMLDLISYLFPLDWKRSSSIFEQSEENIAKPFGEG